MSDFQKVLSSANKYYGLGKYKKALKGYLEAHQLNPKDHSTTINLGNVYMKLGEKSQAFRYFDMAGTNYREQGFYSKSIIIYKRMAKLDPVNLSIREKMIELYLLQKEATDDPYWQQKHQNDALDELNRMGELHRQREESDVAMRYYRRMLEIDELNLKACEKLVEVLVGRQKHREAVHYIGSVAAKFLEKHMLAEVQTALTLAKSIAPQDPTIKAIKAMADIQRGNEAQGFNDLLNLVSEYPEDSEASIYLGKYFMGKNQLEKARIHFLNAYQYLEDSEKGLVSSDLENIAGLLAKANKCELAYETLEPHLDWLIQKGRFDDAEIALGSILSINPFEQKSRKKLFEILHSGGDLDGARRTLEKTVRHYLKNNLLDAAITSLHLGFDNDPENPIWRHMISAVEQQSFSAQDNEVREAEIDDSHKYDHPNQNVDPLTNLPTQQVLMDRFTHAIKHAKRNDERIILLIIELSMSDQAELPPFKILEAANRLASSLRETDSIARIGEHSFAAILHGIGDPMLAFRVAEKVKLSIEGKFLSNEATGVLCRVGITLYPDDEETAVALLENAKLAANQQDGDCDLGIHFFTDEMNAAAGRQRSLARDIRKALDNEEFTLYFQPVINLKNEQKMIGVEVLLRWQNQEMGLLNPAEFLPIAEEIGMMDVLGDWILRETLAKAANWFSKGYQLPWFFVNISSLEFQNQEFEHRIVEILDDSELPEGVIRLWFESRENMMLNSEPESLQRLARIRKLGISLVVDNFGTGNSSLGSLTKSPVEMVKIDRRFVSEMIEKEDSASIIRAILAMAHSFQMQVVAQGIETKEQMNFLADVGCDFAQGYLFSKPIPENELLSWLVNAED